MSGSYNLSMAADAAAAAAAATAADAVHAWDMESDVPIVGGVWTPWLNDSGGGSLRPPVHGFSQAGTRQPWKEPGAYALHLEEQVVSYYGHRAVASLSLELSNGEKLVCTSNWGKQARENDVRSTMLLRGYTALIKSLGYGMYYRGQVCRTRDPDLTRWSSAYCVCGFQARTGDVIDDVRFLLAPHPWWTPESDAYFSASLRARAAAVMEHGRRVLPEVALLKIVSKLREADYIGEERQRRKDEMQAERRDDDDGSNSDDSDF